MSPRHLQPPFAVRCRHRRAGHRRGRHRPSRAAEEAVIIPAPAVDVQAADGIQTAVIAGGCFWGVQGVYQHTAGVLNAVSGYAGGSKTTANYTMVGTGTTGHAEAVEIKYDPKKISYGKILQIFFSVVHDPTQLNRQGPDTGTQYRSAIFTANDEQKKVAEAYIAQLNAAKVYKKPIVTKVGPLQAFYRGGGLSPGLPDAAPEPALYCLQRHPEGREPEEDLCGELHREADAGEQRQGHQLIRFVIASEATQSIPLQRWIASLRSQ